MHMVGSFPRLGRSSGRLPKPCVPRGHRTLGEPDVGAFAGRDIPRARVPFGGSGCFPRARHTPGESAFWDRQLFPGRVLIMYIGQLYYDNPA